LRDVTYQRIQGELQPLGKRVSATAIRATLHRRRLDPAPRPASTTRRAFLRQQAAEIVDCDFSPSTPHRSVRTVDGAGEVFDKPESVTVAA
jgi:hypothetical protein